MKRCVLFAALCMFTACGSGGGGGDYAWDAAVAGDWSITVAAEAPDCQAFDLAFHVEPVIATDGADWIEVSSDDAICNDPRDIVVDSTSLDLANVRGTLLGFSCRELQADGWRVDVYDEDDRSSCTADNLGPCPVAYVRIMTAPAGCALSSADGAQAEIVERNR